MSLLVKAKKLRAGYNMIMGPENADLKWLEFGKIYLNDTFGEYLEKSGDQELAFTILGGRCDVRIEGSPFGAVSYDNIGLRKDPFSGKATLVYVPRNSTYAIKARTSHVDIGVSKSPSRKDTRPILIRPEDLILNSVGVANWRREVYDLLSEDREADRLIIGESITQPGCWTSYPPHKHDTVTVSGEEPYEEIYFFMVKPKHGFGVQLVYSAKDAENPFSEAYIVENGDAVNVSNGYHPCVTGPGYQLYILWMLASEKSRVYGAWTQDPRHTWILDCEPIIKKLFLK